MTKKGPPPNLYLIGAPKSGTSAVVDELSRHPEVFVPELKEPRFFDAHVFYDDPSLYPLKDLSNYLSLYCSEEAANACYRLDGSVFNMYAEDAINNILMLNSDAKFVLILRDPVDAVKSMFIQRLKYASGPMRELHDDFPTCWAKLDDRMEGRGFPSKCKTTFLFRYDLLYSYEKYLPMLEELIPEGNLLVLEYDQLKSDPCSFYKVVYGFLDLDFSFNVANRAINPSIPVRRVWSHELLSFLATLSRPLRNRLGVTGFNYLMPKKELSRSSLRLDAIDSELSDRFTKTYDYLHSKGYLKGDS